MSNQSIKNEVYFIVEEAVMSMATPLAPKTRSMYMNSSTLAVTIGRGISNRYNVEVTNDEAADFERKFKKRTIYASIAKDEELRKYIKDTSRLILTTDLLQRIRVQKRLESFGRLVHNPKTGNYSTSWEDRIVDKGYDKPHLALHALICNELKRICAIDTRMSKRNCTQFSPSGAYSNEWYYGGTGITIGASAHSNEVTIRVDNKPRVVQSKFNSTRPNKADYDYKDICNSLAALFRLSNYLEVSVIGNTIRLKAKLPVPLTRLGLLERKEEFIVMKSPLDIIHNTDPIEVAIKTIQTKLETNMEQQNALEKEAISLRQDMAALERAKEIVAGK